MGTGQAGSLQLWACGIGSQFHLPCLSLGWPSMTLSLQESYTESVSISNLGVAKTGPIVEETGSLLLEYVNGSACTTSDGEQTNYTTRIHLVCSRGNLVSGRNTT